MKLVKFITCAFAISLGFSAANAQQLPNADFETWVNCIPWNSANTDTEVGTTPEYWCVSNVFTPNMSGTLASAAKMQVADKVTGINDSESAVKVFNKETAGQVIPGYFTLGTTWSTARIRTSTVLEGSADGGTWGGHSFSYTPDAVQFDFTHTHGSDKSQPATVVAYLWKGKTSQVDVPAENTFKFVLIGSAQPAEAKTVTMVNRDRNILGMKTLLGGKITKTDDFALIATINHPITDETSEWTSLEIPFEYLNNETPENINLIFSAGKYFAERSEHKANDALTVDNVKLIYYSRLSDIKVNDTPIPDFADDKYEYNVDIPFTNDIAVDGTLLGKSAKQEVTLDPTNYTATIKVSNVDADNDGLAEHSYVVKFAAPQSGDEETSYVYKGTLTIDLSAIGAEDPTVLENQEVNITTTGDATCNFTLYNFSLDEDMVFGDIRVNDVKMTKEDGKVKYEGSVTSLSLADGAIFADVDVEGTEDAEHNLVMRIHVKWLMNGADDHDAVVPIEVTFNGKRTGDDPAGISSIEADNENAEPHYYRINGVEVKEASAPGLYIVRRGNKAEKIIVK